MDLLLSNRAYIYFEEEDLRDLSPIFYAIRMRKTDILELLCDHLTMKRNHSLEQLKNSQGLNLIHYAYKLGFNDVVNYLSLRSKKLLNSEDPHHLTLLMKYIVLNKDFMFANRMISRGADINYRTSDKGLTVLHFALKERNIEAVSFLLQR